MWSLLPLGMPKECATQQCGGAAAWELEVNGVGSYYCQPCKDCIEGQRYRESAKALEIKRSIADGPHRRGQS